MIPGFFANKRNITIVLLLMQKSSTYRKFQCDYDYAICCVFLSDRFHLKEKRDTERFGALYARVHEQKFHLL